MEKNISTLNQLYQRMQHNWPEMATPQLYSTVAFQRISRLFEENAKNSLLDIELTLTEFELLAALRTYPAPYQLMPSELYDALLISSGGLTKVLKSLENRGLIIRSQSNSDRRLRPVQLSEAGIILAEKAMQLVQSGDQRIWEEFMKNQSDNFSSSLDCLIDLVEQYLLTVKR